jgi:hypothetical protein
MNAGRMFKYGVELSVAGLCGFVAFKTSLRELGFRQHKAEKVDLSVDIPEEEVEPDWDDED